MGAGGHGENRWGDTFRISAIIYMMETSHW